MKSIDHKLFKRNLFIIAAAVLIITAVCLAMPSDTSAFAAEKGVIKSAKNDVAGITVNWTADRTKDGYYIYRKEGKSGSWIMVKAITKNTVTSWTDRKVTNGTRYKYKVKSFKGKSISRTGASKKIYRLTRPKITSLKSKDPRTLTVRSNTNDKATGFQIEYSTSPEFASGKFIRVSGTALDRTIKDLSSRTYHVRIRSFRTVGDTKYYSAWSAVRSKWVFRYAYTVNNTTVLHKDTSSDAATDVYVWYRAKLKDLGPAKVTDYGTWRKVSYRGEVYYLWINNSYPQITYKEPRTTYSSSHKYRRAVIEKAMWIYDHWKTKYDYTGRADNSTADENGRHPFDCSGFAAYVLNTAMQEYCPAYEVSRAIGKLGNTGVILNEGFEQELSAVTVCKRKLDTDKLAKGDLIFFNTDDDEDADHVGIYLGNGEFIHATSNYMRTPGDYLDDGRTPAGGVCISPLKGNYESAFMYAKRFAPDSLKNTKINLTLYANKKNGVKVYPNSKCNTGTYIDSLEKGTKVKLLYTIERTLGDGSQVTNGYIKYDTDRYGYVYDYASKLVDTIEESTE